LKGIPSSFNISIASSSVLAFTPPLPSRLYPFSLPDALLIHHATSHSLQLTQVQQVRRELVQGRAVHLVVRHRQVCALGGGWEAGVLGQGQDGGHGVAAVAQRTGSLLADNGVAPPKSRGRA